MSANHARFLRVQGGWVVEDCGSKNGTFLEGARTACSPLGAGQVVELGHTLFQILPSVPLSGDIAEVSARAASPRPLTLDPDLAERLDVVERLSPSRVPILVLGESGTGKEVLARWIHARSGRPGPFVAINCGAIPASLVESTLFGHAKGAFSGSVRDEPGFVRAADGGTLFLDEIADLPKSSQAALLRVLQEGEVVPVGSTRPVPVDVRVLAATHAPLAAMVERGDFRRDLFARIAGAIAELPPLRERRMDLGVLIAALLAKGAPGGGEGVTFTPDAGRAFLRYPWPLNVRELEQCIASSVALAGNRPIAREDLPPAVASALDLAATEQDPGDALGEPDRQRRAELLASLAKHHGNLADVAREMGKARMQVHRWCKRFGIDPNAFRH